MFLFKSIDEVEPAYQQLAFNHCCAVVGKCMMEHGIRLREWKKGEFDTNIVNVVDHT